MARSQGAQKLLDFWAGVPLAATLGALRQGRARPARVDRISLLSPTAIGDMVLASGLVAHLARTFPGAEIHLFHGKTNAAVVPLLPAKVVAHLCDFTKPAPTLRAIRAVKPDLLLDLMPWARLTAILAALSGAYTLGFRAPGQHRHFAFDAVADFSFAHHTTENFRALGELLAPFPDGSPRLNETLPPPPALPYDTLVLCHVAAGGTIAAEKSWPDAYWAELARRLAADGRMVGFTGVMADVPRVDAILKDADLPPEKAFSLCGRFSLSELAAALKRTALLVTVDTGVLHLASALGTPLVGLYGPSHPRQWGALGTHTRNLQAPHPEAGFAALGFERNANGLVIMPSLTVDTVMTAACKLLVGRNVVSPDGVEPSAL